MWFLVSVFLLRANFFLYLFSRCSSLRLKCAIRCCMLYFLYLNIMLSFYISRWLFLIISSYLILISRRAVYDPILYCYCAEFGIFVCRGCLFFVWLQHQGQNLRSDDRCANPRNLFRPFHAPHPSKIAEIEDTQKNVIKKYIFQIFTKNIYNL